MPQYFLNQKIELQNEYCISGDDFIHLTRVRRCAVGDSVVVCSFKGDKYESEITSIDKENLTVCVKHKLDSSKFSQKVILASALLKNKNFEFLLQKAAEIGVSEIVPLITERTVAKVNNPAKIERWKKILSEASKQCLRPDIPYLHDPVSFNELFNLYDSGTRILSHTSKEGCSIRKIVENNKSSNYIIAIGPEGGFSENEVKNSINDGWLLSYTGFTVMRAETAAIVIPAILINEICLDE